MRRCVSDQPTAVAYGVEAAFYTFMGAAAAAGLAAAAVESTASAGSALESS